MSLYLDVSYLKQISGRLEGFKQTHAYVFNCRCRLCGDSSKKKNKKRGYFYQNEGNLFYCCKNCGASMYFGSFLKELDPNLYKHYIADVFKDKASNKIVEEEVKPIPATKPYIPNIFEPLPNINTLPSSVYARSWCDARKLPITTFDFYYAEKFIEWTLGHTNKFEKWRGEDHSRVIIPWHDRTGKILGYSARALDDLQEQKYYRIFVDDSVKEHFFGLDRIDETKQVYVTEGEIDSLMIPNAVAVANGKLQTYMNRTAIYIPDADKRNKHICLLIGRMIDDGLNVCLMPDGLPGKDLNELVKAGFTTEELLDIINANTYSGLRAKLEFNNWKITQ